MKEPTIAVWAISLNVSRYSQDDDVKLRGYIG